MNEIAQFTQGNPYELHEEFTRRILTPVRFKFNLGELNLIKVILMDYISFSMGISSRDYHSRLDVNADIYSAYILHRRLFNAIMRKRDRYTLSLNAVELAVVQRVMYNHLSTDKELDSAEVRQRLMGVRLLYGRIHQKTV